MPASHIREPSLILRAGSEVYERIRQQGLNAQDVSILPGAAGGPKGVGILGLDRAIFGDFLPRAQRLRTLVGASIGSWRFAAVAAATSPEFCVNNLARLADLYTRQRFPKGISTAEVNHRCRLMLVELLGSDASRIISNPSYRLVIATVRSRHVFGANHSTSLWPVLAGVMASNMVSRRALRLFMERVLVYPGEAPLPIGDLKDFVTHYVPLQRNNLQDTLIASAAIPLVLEGVENIAEAPEGIYRDGGLLDYHLDLPWKTDGVVLFPHFTDQVIPGWFDKHLPWRRGNAQQLRSTLLVAPSKSYLSHLPHGKLPDRSDFARFEGDDAGRERYWRQAISESHRLGDEFLELIETGKLADRLQPL